MLTLCKKKMIFDKKTCKKVANQRFLLFFWVRAERCGLRADSGWQKGVRAADWRAAGTARIHLYSGVRAMQKVATRQGKRTFKKL